jgi:diguanylate cyclase (GGDEF)-like protein
MKASRTPTRPGFLRDLGNPVLTFAPRVLALQWAVIAMAAVFVVGTLFRPPGHNSFFDVYLYFGMLVGASVLALARWHLVRDNERTAWLTLGIGMVCWLSGEAFWTVAYGPSENPPSFSAADIGYFAFYPFSYAAVIMLVRVRMRRTPRAVWLDGIVGGLAAASVSAAVFLQPIADSASGSLPFVVANLAYPCADLLLLALVVCSFSLSGWRPDRSWLLLGGGLVALGASDISYLFETAKDSYVEGTPLDIGWPVGMALLGLAPWRRPRRIDVLAFESWTIVVIPLFFALVALAVLTGNRLWNAPSLAVILAFGSICAGFVRLTLTFKEVRSLSELRREARTDELTSLGNRRLFYERMSALLDDRPRERRLALLLIDLDRFKEVNDSLGHQFGDKLLRQVGPRLRDAVGGDDTIARLGGDEFSIILDTGDMRSAVELARRVQNALDKPFQLDGVPVKISASIGIALFPEHATDANQLLRHADVAMYAAKETHASHRIYEPKQDENTRARLTTINELRAALERRDLIVHYQPKFTTSNTLAGAEALVRMSDPKGGLVPPDKFLPLAEQAGLMHLMTAHVLDIVLDDIAKWRERGRYMKVAVNLSVTNLLDSDFPAYVAGALMKRRLPGKALTFEITETTILSDPERARIAVQRLRSLGADISLDDYGTGYASIAYLRQMPLHELKLDRSFVSNLEDDAVAKSFFTSTVTLAHTLGLRVVAEGIETQEMWDAARNAGCDIGQGYFFAKPMNAADFTAKVLANNPAPAQARFTSNPDVAEAPTDTPARALQA